MSGLVEPHLLGLASKCSCRLARPSSLLLQDQQRQCFVDEDIQVADLEQRRRTQIRLAQRAYRQRKETTIAGLNKRVASLEQTIDDMNKIFLDFNDRAIASGIQNWKPALAGECYAQSPNGQDSPGSLEYHGDTVRPIWFHFRDRIPKASFKSVDADCEIFTERLDGSADTFAELAKNGAHESDVEREAQDTTPPDDVLSSRDLKPQMVKHESDPGQQHKQPGADAGLGTSTIWGYSPTYEDPPAAIETQESLSNRLTTVDDVQMQGWDDAESLQQYPVPTSSAVVPASPNDRDLHIYQLEIPSPAHPSAPVGLPQLLSTNSFFPMTKSLPPLTSFSHTETSFARRLVRTSLESAVKILSSPFSTTAEIERFGKFSFCFSNRPFMLQCLRLMIARTTNESLEFWQAPIYHHGGAGLHYPRVGIDASSPRPEFWAESGPIGPTWNYEPESDQFLGWESQMMIEELGMDGEWFDSNDVEQYLRTKGLYLDGQSSIVEVEEPSEMYVPELGAPASGGSGAVSSPSNTNSSAGGPQSPRTDSVPTTAAVYGNEDLFPGDALHPVPDVSEDDVDMASWGGWDFNQGAPPFAPSLDLSKAFSPDAFDFNAFPDLGMPQPARQDQASYFTLKKKKKFVDVDKFLESESRFPPPPPFPPSPLLAGSWQLGGRTQRGECPHADLV